MTYDWKRRLDVGARQEVLVEVDARRTPAVEVSSALEPYGVAVRPAAEGAARWRFEFDAEPLVYVAHGRVDVRRRGVELGMRREHATAVVDLPAGRLEIDVDDGRLRIVRHFMDSGENGDRSVRATTTDSTVCPVPGEVSLPSTLVDVLGVRVQGWLESLYARAVASREWLRVVDALGTVARYAEPRAERGVDGGQGQPGSRAASHVERWLADPRSTPWARVGALLERHRTAELAALLDVATMSSCERIEALLGRIDRSLDVEPPDDEMLDALVAELRLTRERAESLAVVGHLLDPSGEQGRGLRAALDAVDRRARLYDLLLSERALDPDRYSPLDGARLRAAYVADPDAWWARGRPVAGWEEGVARPEAGRVIDRASITDHRRARALHLELAAADTGLRTLGAFDLVPPRVHDDAARPAEVVSGKALVERGPPSSDRIHVLVQPAPLPADPARRWTPCVATVAGVAIGLGAIADGWYGGDAPMASLDRDAPVDVLVEDEEGWVHVGIRSDGA